MGQYSLDALNQLDREAFTAALGDIFEHTPTIADHTWPLRPFASITALHQTMVTVMRSLPHADQLALIRAHPDLGSRAKMATASVQEQASVGLDQLSPEMYEELLRLNQAYRDRFQFPFIIAVKGHTQASILAALQRRLTHDANQEWDTALTEIAQIAHFRLTARITKEAL